jgi:hypothetical protein
MSDECPLLFGYQDAIKCLVIGPDPKFSRNKPLYVRLKRSIDDDFMVDRRFRGEEHDHSILSLEDLLQRRRTITSVNFYYPLWKRG